MAKLQAKEMKRRARHQRIRKIIRGSADRPRLCLHRSLKNLSAQIVDDTKGRILVGISTLQKDVRNKIKSGGNITGAKALGEAVALQAKDKGITKVSFDRGGYLYHGRVKAFAEAARKYSMCPSKNQGGDLGSFSPGEMVAEFDKVVFNDEVGKVHGPVQTKFGFHLIEITSRS